MRCALLDKGFEDYCFGEEVSRVWRSAFATSGSAYLPALVLEFGVYGLGLGLRTRGFGFMDGYKTCRNQAFPHLSGTVVAFVTGNFSTSRISSQIPA